LESVPPRQRAAVVLRYYLGMSLEESASILGCTVGTAKSQASRGLTRLREVLAGENINVTEDSRIGEWTSAGA
jgi:RNA polymerase sigma factor (sigma-70 family)